MFNAILSAFEGVVKSLNGTVLSAIGDGVSILFSSLPAPLTYLLALFLLGMVICLLRNVMSFILQIGTGGLLG